VPRRALSVLIAWSLTLAGLGVCSESGPLEFLTWARTPPMGWNSWDAFGTTITEAQAKAQADAMAERLLPYGWRVLTVDIQWYEPGAAGHSYRPDAPLVMDGWGRLLPAPNRFPSAANGGGFKPLADYVHAKGLQLGIHLMRGIPRLAVEQNLPVKGTSVHAAEIADTSSTCAWNPDMYGVDMTRPGAQAYYDSVFEQIASWGVDFVKVDDISRPYLDNIPEIEAIRRAIDRTGRPMVLSLSPGETAIEAAEHVVSHANMWRISDDFWDSWPALLEQFARLARWSPYCGPGHWPDADMLPLGVLEMGRRTTRLAPEEQRTLLTLWSIARSPLIFGGDMTRMDPATLELLTNPEVIAVDQHSRDSRRLFDRDGLVAWVADVPGSEDRYLALFNTRDRFPLDLSRPVFVSPLVTRETPGHGVDVDVDLAGAARLVLVAEGGEDGTGWDHALWVEPRLVMRDGTERRLTERPWVQAWAGWGEVSTETSPSGRAMVVEGRTVPYGIAAHARSLVEYAIPEGAVRFRALAALDDGGLTGPSGGSVVFSVHALGAAPPADAAGVEIPVPLPELGLGPRCDVRDLWQRRELGVVSELAPVVRWHGSVLYRLRAAR
jgi:alpha-galactosidase